MCLAFFSQIIIVAVPSLLYFSPSLYVCFNFLFSLHLGALVSIHPHPAVVAAATAAWKCILFFYGGALQGTENKKDERKEAARRKEDQGVYTQTFCVERREINFTIISHGSVCRFCSLRAR
jgi:hypothetical protein